jgi:hypothetical protein
MMKRDDDAPTEPPDVGSAALDPTYSAACAPAGHRSDRVSSAHLSRIRCNASSTRSTATISMPAMACRGALAFGDQGAGEAELGGFLQALLDARCRAHLPSATDLT